VLPDIVSVAVEVVFFHCVAYWMLLQNKEFMVVFAPVTHTHYAVF